MLAHDSLLATVLRQPELLGTLKPSEWDLLLPQARRAGMLAHLAWIIEKSGQSASGRAGEYLEGARAVSIRQAQAVHFEVGRIQSALAESDIPVILLKGAAYQIAGLPCSAGRTFTDIDLLVPLAQIATVEKLLRLQGWGAGHNSPYDERYYRKWMHEIPPLMHIRRQTVIDLHHAILPLTARIKSASQPLFENARRLSGFENLFVLAPADMLLHSATHLFTEGDYNHGLRDLADLDSLVRHFSAAAPDFWQELRRRANLLNLGRPLFYALRYCQAVLNTPVPAELAKLNKPVLPTLMDALFGRALAPEHVSCADGLSGLARWLLYIRGHWLRMPLHLLLPHLFHKAFLVEREEAKREREKENGADRPR
jgi:hypothetical protein